jgi:dimethylamine/trimethylamine dehydrogenase
VKAFDGETVTLADIFSGVQTPLEARSLVVVGHRAPVDDLYCALQGAEGLAAAGIRSLTVTGDALAPGAIVHAVYNGHKAARELGAGSNERPRRDFPVGRASAFERASVA